MAFGLCYENCDLPPHPLPLIKDEREAILACVSLCVNIHSRWPGSQGPLPNPRARVIGPVVVCSPGGQWGQSYGSTTAHHSWASPSHCASQGFLPGSRRPATAEEPEPEPTFVLRTATFLSCGLHVLRSKSGQAAATGPSRSVCTPGEGPAVLAGLHLQLAKVGSSCPRPSPHAVHPTGTGSCPHLWAEPKGAWPAVPICPGGQDVQAHPKGVGKLQGVSQWP